MLPLLERPGRVASRGARATVVHVLVLAAAVVGCYANSLEAPFVLDDEASIVLNPSIGSWEEYQRLEPPTRRIAYLSFKLDYRLWGLRPEGFRATNIVIHLIAVLATYALGRVLLGASPSGGPSAARATFTELRNEQAAACGKCPTVATWAFAGALLFAVHPIQTQAVTYVVQRIASLATLFYVAALALYAWVRLGETSHRAKVGAYAGAVAAALLAMRTKEIAFTLPFAIVLLELGFATGSLRRRVGFVAPFLALLPVIPTLVLWSRSSLAALLTERTTSMALAGISEAARVDTSLGRLEYLATQARVIVTYLRLLLVPVGQNLDYDYPVERSFASLPVLCSAAVVVGVAVLGVSGLARNRLIGLRVAGAGALLFLLGLSVESTLVPITDVIFEHRMYLPMTGAALVVGGLGSTVAMRWPGRERWAVVALTAWALVLGTATVARNRVWGDGVTLWSDVAQKSPAKARAHFNLGNALFAAGDLEAAGKSWVRATELDPSHSWALNQLGNLALVRGDRELAETYYRKAIHGEAVNPEALYNLGMLLEATGRGRDAIPLYRRFVEMNPFDRPREVAALRARIEG